MGYDFIIVEIKDEKTRRGTQIPIWSFIKNIEMDTETCLHLKKKVYLQIKSRILQYLSIIKTSTK